MSVKVRVKAGYLYLDVIQNRIHHWEALHIKLSSNAIDRKEQMRFAESCRAKRELQIAMGEWNFADKISGRQTLANYIENAYNEKKHHTTKNLLNWVREYKDGGQIQLQNITDSWCRSFQKFLIDSGRLSDFTVNLTMGKLKGIFNKAVSEDVMAKNPARNIKPLKVGDREKAVLSLDEVALFSGVETNTEREEMVKKAFLFSCYTGLRISDLRTLKWENIEKRAVSKYNQCQYWLKKNQIKTKRTVEIPLPMSVFSLIAPQQFPGILVFGRLVDRNGNVTIKRLAERAGIKKNISWHTARRTFATLELESGADPFTVQRLMGHKKIEMTGIYAKSNNIKSSAVIGLQNMIEQSEKEREGYS